MAALADDEAAAGWPERTEAMLADTPEPVAERHREWVGEQDAELTADQH